MTFRRYAADRILVSLAVLFLAASLTYAIFHVVGTPLATRSGRVDPAQLERTRRYSQESYGGFLWQLVGHGSLGRGIYSGVDLTEPVFARAPVTLSVVGGALVFAVLVGMPLGFLWSRRRRLGRFAAASFSQLGLAVSPIWAGPLLLWLLAFKTSLVPAGYCNFSGRSPGGGCGGPIEWAHSLILPSVILGLAFAGLYAVVTRRLIASVARARRDAKLDGADALRAARRRALTAFAKIVARDASWLIGTTLFVEQVFGLPGLGLAAYGSVVSQDPPVMEAILVASTMLTVGLSLAVDLAAGAILPGWRANER